MQGMMLDGFWEALKESDWNAVLLHGKRLFSSASLDERINLSLQMCTAAEYLGLWLQIADLAAAGLKACEAIGITDNRYAFLLRALGRGQYDRQLYDEAWNTYARLYQWARGRGCTSDIIAAKYSMACCAEKLGPHRWAEAIRLYEAVYSNHAANWPHRLAATVNQVNLVMRRDGHEAAYDLATTRFLSVPSEAKAGTPWAEFLIIVARLMVHKGEPNTAEVVASDAIEITPDNRPATTAKAHAVRALALHEIGIATEAQEEIELAWSFAEIAPAEEVYMLIQEVERTLKGGDQD